MIVRRIAAIWLFCALLSACAVSTSIPSRSTDTSLPNRLTSTPSRSPLADPTEIPSTPPSGKTVSNSAITRSPSITARPSGTFTPTDTLIPTPSSTATWTYHPAGQVTAPILLYHHVAPPVHDSRYYVDPDVFKTQMEALIATGYTTISMATLVNVMDHGGLLPVRPIIITFDDGNLDVYQNAFPVMKSLGLVGTVYIVTRSLDDPRYLGEKELTEMIQAGWEVGSHTRTHSILANSDLGLKVELYQSRIDLEKLLNVPVTSISYPFGLTNDYILKKAREYGYESGAGLGGGSDHPPKSVMYLTRIEVKESYSLAQLGGLLPWWIGPVEPLSTATPTAH